MTTLLDIVLDAMCGHWPGGRHDLAQRVGRHIGARLGHADGTPVMRCPVCGGDFGPTMTLEQLACYEDGYLPGAPLLLGVCLDCGHVTSPAAGFGPLGDPREQEPRR